MTGEEAWEETAADVLRRTDALGAAIFKENESIFRAGFLAGWKKYQEVLEDGRDSNGTEEDSETSSAEAQPTHRFRIGDYVRYNGGWYFKGEVVWVSELGGTVRVRHNDTRDEETFEAGELTLIHPVEEPTINFEIGDRVRTTGLIPGLEGHIVAVGANHYTVDVPGWDEVGVPQQDVEAA